MKPLISIIIPVYNGEKFIAQCIQSVEEQTLGNLQIIIVDDGSTDCTFEILQKFAFEDSRIEIIHQENGGVSKARNSGLSIAKGDWILFIDSDDSIDPNYCEYMLDAALNLHVDVLIAHPKMRGKKDKYLLESQDKLIRACLSNDEMSFPFNIDAPWGKLFQTSIIQDHHIQFPEMLTRSEDAFFCLSFYSKATSIGALNYWGYIHNEREGSLCRCFMPSMMDILEKILEENQKWVIKYRPNEEEYDRALWYRVLPGIVECERTYFLHYSNPDKKIKTAVKYQHFLNRPIIRQAINQLKIKDILKKQYKIRLLLYKLHMGWFFILIKRK